MTEGSYEADELAVRNVISRMAEYGDRRELDDLLSLFTEDAVLEAETHPVLQPDDPAAVRRNGRSEIEEVERRRRSEGMVGPGSGTHHAVSTVSVTVEGAVASAHATWAFFTGTMGTPKLAAVGRYELQLRRTSDGWRIARRKVTFG